VDGEVDFAPFVRAHGSDLLRAAVLLAGSRERAEDLLQDTLTYLYPRWEKVASADAPEAYVRRALVNRFISERRSPRRNIISVSQLPERSDQRDLSETVATKQAVWELLESLPDRQRAALVLRYFYDFSDSQIAEVLGCRVSTVRSIISRALTVMRHGLAPDAADSKAGM
jgi:RNA polymerase sigma-70 factor (sigma-E family)